MTGDRLMKALVVAATLAMMVGMTSPAVGKGKPTRSTPVVVTLAHVGTGMATTCPGGPLAMEQSGHLLRLDWEPGGAEVEMSFPIPWERHHPEYVSGDVLTGCHGGLVAESDEGFGGYLIISENGSGGVALTGRFDYYWEYELEQQGKKYREVQQVLEFLEVSADLVRTDRAVFDWETTGTPQEVSGQLELWSYEKLADGGQGWVSLGTANIQMMITLARS